MAAVCAAMAPLPPRLRAPLNSFRGTVFEHLKIYLCHSGTWLLATINLMGRPLGLFNMARQFSYEGSRLLLKSYDFFY
jgi:hypothetical protein